MTKSAVAAVKATRCSTRLPRRVPASGWSAASRRLAPAGALTIRLCRYSALTTHPPLMLVGTRLLTDSGLVRQLIAEFDGLPPSPKPGIYVCVTDDGPQIVALIAYRGGHELAIRIHLTGCFGVANGSVERTTYPIGSPPQFGSAFLARLEGLVPARFQAPRCLSSQLRLATGPRVSEKTEQDTRLLVLRNVSGERCDLEGYPVIVLLESQGVLGDKARPESRITRRGTVLSFSYRPHGDQMLSGAYPAVVPLAPGASAYFGINKTPCVLYSREIAARIRVTPPGDSHALSLAWAPYPTFDYCRPPDAGSIIDVTPIEPSALAVFAPA